MKIYLDMCCFNRPYDDQTQSRIHLETGAKLLLQQKVKNAECGLVWSSVLDFECHNNPFEERRCAVAGQADLFITTDDRLIKKMRKSARLPTVLPGKAIALVENWYEN